MPKILIAVVAILMIFAVQTLYIPAEARSSGEFSEVSYRAYDSLGERVGTCRRGSSMFFNLYDMNNKLVKNPAEFLKQPADDCYLFDADGYAYGKCTSTRIIIWK